MTIPEGLLPRIVDDSCDDSRQPLHAARGGKDPGESKPIVSSSRSPIRVLEQRYLLIKYLRVERDALAGFRQIMYAVSQIVLDENVTDLKTNVGLLTQSELSVLNLPMLILSARCSYPSLSKDDAEDNLNRRHLAERLRLLPLAAR